MKTCPAGHPTAFRTCVRCLDMIAAAKIDLTKRAKPERETRGRKKGCTPNRPATNEAGKRYGRLTVIRRDDSLGPLDGVRWLCLCDCGKEKLILGYSLRRGTCISCGCRAAETRQLGRLARQKSPEPRKAYILTEADKARAKRISDKVKALASMAQMASRGPQESIQAMMRRRA